MSHIRQRSNNVSRTQPVTEPIDVSDVKNNVGIMFDDNDSVIKLYIQAARQYIEENLLWQALLTQTAVDKFDTFAGEFFLHWAPVQSITSIQYVDQNGTTQTLSTDIYELSFDNGEGVVRLKEDQIWPSTQTHQDSVTITYVAGFGDAEDVPARIRQALIILAGAWQLNPDGDIRIPLAVDSLLVGQGLNRVIA